MAFLNVIGTFATCFYLHQFNEVLQKKIKIPQTLSNPKMFKHFCSRFNHTVTRTKLNLFKNKIITLNYPNIHTYILFTLGNLKCKKNIKIL